MPNDIFNLLNKPVANPNKNGFDLGQFFPFSLKLGQVKPMYFLDTVPQGHYKISVDELCHTEPFITDPFVRLSKHIEVVFVPYSQLWHGYTQFIGHAQDPQSSYEQGHAVVPNFNLGNMLERIWNYGLLVQDMQGLSIQQSALSLLDMLGYGAHPLYKMSDAQRTNYINYLKTRYVNAWPLLAYNKYWNVYLRDTQHTSPLNPAIFNADLVPCTNVATSHMDDYYTDEQLLELVTIKYRKRKKDIFTSALTSRQFGAVEGVQIDFNLSNLEIHGSGNKIGVVAGGSTAVTDVNNNYVFEGGYEFKTGRNVDYLLANSSVPTNAIMQAQTSSDGWSNVRHTHNLSGLSGDVNSINGNTDLRLVGDLAGGFDVYTLLTAQMMQKWREQIQRAGNRAEDRLRALYGVSPSSDAKNSPYIIGSTTYDLNANQVTSTSASESVRLGDIAAKGIGYAQRNSFEFTASEFGIIMVVSYILPENNYLAPIDKNRTLIEPFDYFTEQLENLGLEQIEGELLGTAQYDQSNDSYSYGVFDSPGFAARYWNYKQKVNVIHLGFEHGQENSKWIPSRIEGLAESWNFHYVAPNEYDTVFGTRTDYTLATDQFIGAARVSCDSVLPMSELGLPRW